MVLFFNDTATTEIYTLSLHGALPIFALGLLVGFVEMTWASHRISREIEEQRAINRETEARVAALKGEAEFRESDVYRSEGHTSELQSRQYLVCRLLLEKTTSPSTRCK